MDRHLDWPAERRLFLATPIAPEMQRTLQALQTRLQQQEPRLRLVRPDNLHLTLRFLGQTTAATAQALCRTLDQDSLQGLLPAFCQPLNQTEYWPQPAILCLTGLLVDPALQQLDQRLDQLALQLGFAARHHPLRPHITLARKATAPPPIASAQFAPVMFPYQARQLVLYHSDSTPEGVRYRPLAQWPLALKATADS